MDYDEREILCYAQTKLDGQLLDVRILFDGTGVLPDGTTKPIRPYQFKMLYNRYLELCREGKISGVSPEDLDGDDPVMRENMRKANEVIQADTIEPKAPVKKSFF